MSKRIVICADGTWNRPEKDLKKDVPTNVLKLARAIKPIVNKDETQEVFYDWGIGSYYDKAVGGVTGRGIEKNVVDCYRYIVQNFSPKDELFFFGFSRGAYTVRSLCGLIRNSGIMKRNDARWIQEAFNLYKKTGKKYKPDNPLATAFRKAHSHSKYGIRFIGVLDTVGAFGIPLSFMGFLNKRDEFYDTKMGPIVTTARHAMAIDERRSDFEPTIWEERTDQDLKQVWFAGSHSDVGGGYSIDKKTGGFASDIPLAWMIKEAHAAGLIFETHLAKGLKPNPASKINKSRKFIYRAKKVYNRPIDHGKSKLLIHRSVKERWDNNAVKYRPKKLEEYLSEHNGTWPELVR